MLGNLSRKAPYQRRDGHRKVIRNDSPLELMGALGIRLRELRALILSEPTGFVWIYEGKLAGSGYPASKSQVEWLSRKGISSILSLTEEPLPDSWLKSSMNYSHIPMRDHEPPDQESLSSAAARIDSELGSGRVMLVHCQAGIGRTMCAIAAYLIKSKPTGAEEVITFLRSIKPGAVESRQEISLREFAASLRRGDSRNHP